jgi:hypothetical protein
MNETGEGGSTLLIPGIVLLLTFLSGIGFGLFMGSHFSSSSASENATPINPSTDFPGLGGQTENQVDIQLNSRIHDLEMELAEQKSDPDALIFQDRLAFLKKHGNGFINLHPFDRNLKVTSEMADVLELTKAEQQAVEQHLAGIKNEVDKFEAANTTLVKQSSNSVTLEIAANPGGEALKSKLSNLISTDIGADRAELFMNAEAHWGYDTLSGFDQEKKQVEIKWEDQNGSLLYKTKEDYFGSDGNPTHGSESSGNAFPPDYAKLLQPEPGQ